MSSIWTLRRSATDSKISGLCGGVAEHWGVDPVLVRVGCALLALSGGVGAVLYLAGWLLIPVEGRSTAAVDDLIGPQARRWPKEAWIAIVVVACVLSFVAFGAVTPFGIGPALLLAVIWYFGFYRHRRPRSDSTPPEGGRVSPSLPSSTDQPTTPFTEAADAWRRRVDEHARQVAAQRAATGVGDQRWPAPPSGNLGPAAATAPWSEVAEPGPRPSAMGQAPAYGMDAPVVGADPNAGRAAFLAEADPVGLYVEPTPTATPAPRPGRTPAARRLRLVGILLLGLTLAGLGMADYSGMTVPPAAYFGAALLVVGLTLIASAWFGRARGLLGLGAVLLVGLLATSAIPSGVHRADWMDVTRSYTSVSALPAQGDNMDLGRMTVDLSHLSLTGDANYRAHVDLGSLTVVAPPDTNVRVDYGVDSGAVRVFDSVVEAGSNLHGTHDTASETAGRPTLTLTLSVDSGSVTVRR